MPDAIGDRMKTYYENRYRFYLTRRTPVILRVDGKSFHTFTRSMERPYDLVLQHALWDTAKYLCENIMGAKFAYVQSDEISVLILDYSTKLTTEAWLDYNQQKMVSIGASMATMAFNRAFTQHVKTYGEKLLQQELSREQLQTKLKHYQKAYKEKVGFGMFDARVFNVPENDVCNYFIWRQQDAIKNSISMLGRTQMKQSELQGKNTKTVVAELRDSYDINWHDAPLSFQRGTACHRTQVIEHATQPITQEIQTVVRRPWVMDTEIPVFTQDRNYVEQYLLPQTDAV